MARVLRWMLYLTSTIVVVGFSKLHAARVGHYDIIDTGRLPWLGAFIVVLCLAAYAVGLPDLAGARGSRGALPAALIANASAVGAISFLQLADGAAHLPRFVVLASAAVLAPAYAAIALVANGRRVRSTERQRVLAVGSEDDTLALIEDLRRAPERPAMVVRSLTVEAARGGGPRAAASSRRRVAPSPRWWCCRTRRRPTTRS